jgi:hypothetical protein
MMGRNPEIGFDEFERMITGFTHPTHIYKHEKLWQMLHVYDSKRYNFVSIMVTVVTASINLASNLETQAQMATVKQDITTADCFRCNWTTPDKNPTR